MRKVETDQSPTVTKTPKAKSQNTRTPKHQNTQTPKHHDTKVYKKSQSLQTQKSHKYKKTQSQKSHKHKKIQIHHFATALPPHSPPPRKTFSYRKSSRKFILINIQAGLLYCSHYTIPMMLHII